MNLRRSLRLVAIVLVCAFAAPAFATDSLTLAAVKACRRAITNRGKTYANKRRFLLFSCIDRLLKCELKREINDAPPTFNYGTCRSDALSACKRKLGNQSDSSLSLAKMRFDTQTPITCTPAAGVGVFSASRIMSNTAGGGNLWYSNDTTCGTSADLATLVQCLRGEIEPRVDAVVSRVKPRGGLLLDNAGYGTAFPNLTRPTSVTQTIDSAMPNDPMDPLGTAGTITLAAGEALKLDATSNVDCTGGMGMGMAGHLTISIGTLPFDCNTGTAVQTFTLNAPYGAGEFAIAGPFVVDQGYCVKRKDGGACNMDTISGTIDVPDGTLPATASLTVLACQNRFEFKVRALAIAVANKTHNCTERIVRCKLRDEIDPGMPPLSVCSTTSVQTLCNAVPVAIATKLTNMKDPLLKGGIPKKCSLVSWDSLTAFIGGLGFVNVAAGAGCASGDLGCLMDAVLGTPTGTGGTKCDVEHKVFIRDPRAQDSLLDATYMLMTPATNFPCVAP